MLQMLGLLVADPLVPEKMTRIEFVEFLQRSTDLRQNIEMMIPLRQILQLAVDFPQFVLKSKENKLGLIDLFPEQIFFGNFGSHCVTLTHMALEGRSHL